MRRPAPSLRLLAPAVLATFALAACGGGSSDGSSSDEPDGTDTAESGSTTTGGNEPAPGDGDDARDLGTTPTWQLDGRFDYEGALAGSITRVSNVGGPDFGILALPAGTSSGDNGPYIGGAVSLAHSLEGDGNYTVVPTEEFDRVLENSPGSRVIRFTVQAGAGALGEATIDSTQWEGVNGTLEVVVDDDDVYHFFSDEAIPMRVTLDTGAGIPDRPDDTTVTFDNVHGRPAP